MKHKKKIERLKRRIDGYIKTKAALGAGKENTITKPGSLRK